MEIKVLDTNVLLDRPFEDILKSFEEPSLIVIPHIVLKELDTFKKGVEPKNEFARAAIRILDGLRSKGDLSEGVSYGKHIVKVLVDEKDLDLDKSDYEIIRTARDLSATLITQDINERVVADAVGVKVTNFAPHHVNVNELYKGYTEIEITFDESVEFAQYDTKYIPAGDRQLIHNQFVIMRDNLGAVYEGIYKADSHRIYKLKPHYEAFGIRPAKDKITGDVLLEQKFLLHLLLDPDIHFVTAIGPSGCGKTLLTLAAALEQTLNGDKKGSGYKKITVMRPLIAVGQDIGYLPGDKLEKLEPWMGSTFDALEYLLAEYPLKDCPPFAPRDKIYRLIENGQLELEAMAHIRGRSIPNQFLIVDDAQNLTIQEAVTIITRAGEKTKVVFLGDLSEKQIDNYRLTPSSNGLAYVIDRLKGEDVVGHITLEKVVRSRLAQLGVEKL